MQEIIERVSDRQKLIRRLLHQFSESSRRFKGLEQAAETVLTNYNEANTRKMLNTSMKILRDQMEINRDLIALMVMLCSSDDFISWQATLAMKVGSDPKDVLSKMFDMKMKGEY